MGSAVRQLVVALRKMNNAQKAFGEYLFEIGQENGDVASFAEAFREFGEVRIFPNF